ncbi:MAG TPA: ATP-binding protein [Thermoanaerobaculia bacterium]|nr:ATP-binding protein [Thermoanaerobaculia bacterium]
MSVSSLTTESGPIRMSLSSRFENIEMAQHLCGKLVDGRGLPDETRHWILMALREALANAIKHGNARDLAKRVHLEMNVVDGWLQIRICDEGAGFDPSKIDDPLAPENRLKTSGRGIFYMKTFMDEVRFSRAEGGGTELVLRKNLAVVREKEERKV